MYCQNCGNEIPNGAIVCPYCATPINGMQPQPQEPPKKSKWWIAVIVIFVVTGIVIGAITILLTSTNDRNLIVQPITGKQSNDSYQVETTTAKKVKSGKTFEVGNCKVQFLSSKIYKDSTGNNFIILDYKFTNGTSEPTSFDNVCCEYLYQDGVELDLGILIFNDNYDASLADKSIQPGVSINVQKCYKLSNLNSDVQVEVKELWDFSNEICGKFTIKLK